ncbi:MAG: PAS domain S-box protein, partial [Bacteroidales bacterium]|nr:PAS domain S-box protein [Bacteroidales bacterium]
MISITKQFQILYELALCIGNGKNQQEAAETAISLYLKKLNCFAGAILKKEIIENRCNYKHVSSIPANIEAIESYKELLKGLSKSAKDCISDFDDIKTYALQNFKDTTQGYLFELPGFGILILLGKGDAFSETFMKHLLPLNKKLADSLIDLGEKIIVNQPFEVMVSDTNEASLTELNIKPVFDGIQNTENSISNGQDTSQNKLDENELLKNETILHTLVQNIPDLIWLKNKEGVYLACNPGFERFFGAKEAEIVGKTDYDFVDKELGDFFRANDKIAMEAGEPTINEEEVTFACDGHKALLETIKTPITDKRGNTIGVLGIARDITERKFAEVALKESIQRFQEIANLLPQPIWETDAKGKFTFANKAGFEVLGYKPEDVAKGLNFLQVIAPADRERITANFEKKLKGIETNDFEYNCIKKTGETFPVLIYTSPIKRADKIIGVRGITLDISNLKNAQENLKYFSSLQEVLIHISTKYINVSTDEIDNALQDALREIGEFVSADRAYIFDYDFNKEITNNTYEWCEAGIEPQIENLQGLPLEAIPQWVEKHVKAETIYIADVMALPPGDDLRVVLEPQGIKSLIAVPMMHGGECFGFIGFDSVRS